MRAALGLCDVPVVVDGEEDMGRFRKVGERGANGREVGVFHQDKRHGGSEEDDVRFGEAREDLALEILLPE